MMEIISIILVATATTCGTLFFIDKFKKINEKKKINKFKKKKKYQGLVPDLQWATIQDICDELNRRSQEYILWEVVGSNNKDWEAKLWINTTLARLAQAEWDIYQRRKFHEDIANKANKANKE